MSTKCADDVEAEDDTGVDGDTGADGVSYLDGSDGYGGARKAVDCVCVFLLKGVREEGNPD